MKSVFKLKPKLALFFCMLLAFVVASSNVHAQVSADYSNGGAIVIGPSTSACDSSTEGGIRYSTTNQNIEFCDGTNWQTVTSSGNAVNLVLTPATSNTMDISSSGSPAYGSYVTFTVENIGNVTSQSLSVVLSNQTNFELGTDNCSGNTLGQNATCTIQVRPKAFGDGSYSGLLTINANNNPSAELSGTASGSCGTIGTAMNGGLLVSCESDHKLIAMEGGCDGTVNEPTCVGSLDTLEHRWAGSSGTDINASSYSDGRSNAEIAIMYSPHIPHQAIHYCASLTHNGYSDWYLPARNELNLVANVRNTLGKFQSERYLSSTERDSNAIKGVMFSDGTNSDAGKTYLEYIRCVRREETYSGANLVWSPGGTESLDINSAGSPAYSSPQTFTLTNNGTATSSSISLTVGNSDYFELVSGQDNCSGNSLAAAASCTVQVRAKSSKDGTLYGAVQVNQNNRPILGLKGTATNVCGTIGSFTGGGVLVSCRDGYQLITTPGNCTDSATPVCDNATDTLHKAWSTETVDINSDDTSDGRNNETVVMARVSTSGVGTYPAVEYCANMTYGGYSDWYLPSTYEMYILTQNFSAIGTLSTNNWYNTSTERDSSRNYVRYTGNGNETSNNKSTNYRVRCVRRN